MIHEKLLKWYDQNKRNLPWRHKRNPYRVWISEIMLQQTQVKTVIPYFNKWMQKYPNIKALKNANYDDVLKTWEGLGYYSRCKNIYNAAQIITKSFPKTYKDLISLPGIGDYTAKTILAIAYDKKSVGIDTNLERFKTVFAAAGHPNCIFKIEFDHLTKLTSGKIKEITE